MCRLPTGLLSGAARFPNRLVLCLFLYTLDSWIRGKNEYSRRRSRRRSRTCIHSAATPGCFLLVKREEFVSSHFRFSIDPTEMRVIWNSSARWEWLKSCATVYTISHHSLPKICFVCGSSSAGLCVHHLFMSRSTHDGPKSVSLCTSCCSRKAPEQDCLHYSFPAWVQTTCLLHRRAGPALKHQSWKQRTTVVSVPMGSPTGLSLSEDLISIWVVSRSHTRN